MKHTITKTALVLFFLLIAISSRALAGTPLPALMNGTVNTVGGLGGGARVGFYFAQGDKIKLSFHAQKQLERAVAFIDGTRVELAKLRSTKNGEIEITMPQDGNVVIMFVNAHGGANEISYQLSGQSEIAMWKDKAAEAATAAALP